MAQSNKSIDNDLKYQILKAEMEADQIRKGYNNESLLKLKDYINNDLECKILKIELEKNEIDMGCNNEELLKYIVNTKIETDKQKPKEKEKKVQDESVDVEKLLSALDKIVNKLLDLEYYNATIINELVSYITEDSRIIKGTHLKKDNIDKLIHDMDNLISDAEYDLDNNELMILYFGIYLARVKNKKIRNKGARKVVNTILHPPVQDLI